MNINDIVFLVPTIPRGNAYGSRTLIQDSSLTAKSDMGYHAGEWEPVIRFYRTTVAKYATTQFRQWR